MPATSEGLIRIIVTEVRVFTTWHVSGSWPRTILHERCVLTFATLGVIIGARRYGGGEPAPYKRVRELGIVFYFKYNDRHPEFLHIYVRHLTDIDDALDVFFDPGRHDEWNEEHRRWESRSSSYMLYWTWLEEGEKVLVITCFTL